MKEGKNKKITWILLLFAFNLFLFALFVAVTPSRNLTQAAFPKCLDGDGSITMNEGLNFVNPLKRGIALEYDSTGKVKYSKTDYCSAPMQCWGTDDSTIMGCLVEYYCTKEGTIYSKNLNCNCINGECTGDIGRPPLPPPKVYYYPPTTAS